MICEVLGGTGIVVRLTIRFMNKPIAVSGEGRKDKLPARLAHCQCIVCISVVVLHKDEPDVGRLQASIDASNVMQNGAERGTQLSRIGNLRRRILSQVDLHINHEQRHRRPDAI